MKTKPVRSKKEFQSKLAAYSATATAVLLVAPAVADAQVYNLTQFSIDGNRLATTPPDVLVNGSGAGDEFLAVNQNFSLGAYAGLFALNSSKGGAALIDRLQIDHLRFANTNGQYASKLALHSQINGVGRNFDVFRNFSQITLAYQHNGQFTPVGPDHAVTGYVGFKDIFSVGRTYFGWLRVRVANDANGDIDEVSLVAKDGVFGAMSPASDIITAGEIAPVPEPSTAALGGLGLLALGARGVWELRRRRKNPIVA